MSMWSAAAELLMTVPEQDVVLAQEGESCTGWDCGPEAPPGLDGLQGDWIGWAKWVAILAGILGLIACGVMMMIGRRNRGHLAAEGASGLLWVVAGLSVVSLAGGVVPLIVA